MKLTKLQLKNIIKAEVKKVLAAGGSDYKFLKQLGKYKLYADLSGVNKYDYITGALSFVVINIASEDEFPTVKRLIEKEVNSNPDRYRDARSKKLAFFNYADSSGDNPGNCTNYGEGITYSFELGRAMTKAEEADLY